MRSLAAEGRTVFVSSHLISEMAVTAERLIVIGRGRLLADTTVTELAARAGGSLEDAFFDLAGESAEFRGGDPARLHAGAPPAPGAGAPGQRPGRGRS
jgi:ABC-2 type transport system ATP-binding protein